MLSLGGLFALSTFAAPQVVLAGRLVRVSGPRMSESKEVTRVVFDLSGPVYSHSLFVLHEPERVVVDIKGARAVGNLRTDGKSPALLRGVRHAQRNGRDLRLVLDLRRKATPRSFVLKPSGGNGYRLVIDLHHQAGKSNKPVITARAHEQKRRDVIVAIDPGHGGKDPGAIGPRGTREKDVVLAVARRLKKHIDRQPGMRAVLTRDRDIFLPLRERMKRARAHRADLFVSVHADASPDHRVSGSSVYVLSENGATSELARWLAERENSADLVGGVKLSNVDNQLASVLLDLSQDHTIEESLDLAEDMLNSLGKINRLRSKRVEKAAFAVLKSPDIPSVLVETAFISNPKEERRLRSRAHQEKIAKALYRGIRAYFRDNAPDDSLLASLQQKNRG
ncbi:MAG: AMIN domain-containing protein [Gammaproteobacteria bacterium]|nr:MAG: AMIN domain-containing protein [Gammaproteobacteria bacterium]